MAPPTPPRQDVAPPTPADSADWQDDWQDVAPPTAAVAWSEVLLTLDTGDFGPLMEGGFYGLPVTTPGAFLEQQRPTDGTTSGGTTG